MSVGDNISSLSYIRGNKQRFIIYHIREGRKKGSIVYHIDYIIYQRDDAIIVHDITNF